VSKCAVDSKNLGDLVTIYRRIMITVQSERIIYTNLIESPDSICCQQCGAEIGVNKSSEHSTAITINSDRISIVNDNRRITMQQRFKRFYSRSKEKIRNRKYL